MHILDIVENSVAAKATLIEIEIRIDEKENFLSIKIKDNGKGIEKDLLEKIESPFYTSKKERKIKVGLGIPLFKFSALQSGGEFKIDSKKGEYTQIVASFKLDNIDRPPLGDVYNTLLGLIIAHQSIDFIIKIIKNNKIFEFDTRQIKEIIGDISFTYPDVYEYISRFIKEGIEEIGFSSKKEY